MEIRALVLVLATAAQSGGIGPLTLPLIKDASAPPPVLGKPAAVVCADKEYTVLEDWGERLAMRRWVENNLRTGRALQAPLMRGEDVHLALLYPIEIGRPRLLRAAPAGILLKFKL